MSAASDRQLQEEAGKSCGVLGGEAGKVQGARYGKLGAEFGHLGGSSGHLGGQYGHLGGRPRTRVEGQPRNGPLERLSASLQSSKRELKAATVRRLPH